MTSVEDNLTKLIKQTNDKHYKSWSDLDIKTSVGVFDRLCCSCCLSNDLIQKHDETTFYIHFAVNKPTQKDFLTREYLNEILEYKGVNKSNEIYQFNTEPITEQIRYNDGRAYILNLCPVAIYEDRKPRKDNLIIPFLTNVLETLLEDKFYFVVFKIKYSKVKMYSVEKLERLIKNNEPTTDTLKRKATKKGKKKGKKNKKLIEQKCNKCDDTISEDTISEDTVSENTVSDDTISEDTISEDTISENTVSDDTVSDDKISDDTVSDDKISDDDQNNTMLNIIFDKNNEFQDREYLKTLIHHIYYSNIKIKQYFDDYDILYIIKDLHFDNNYIKRGYHFNLKLISKITSTPTLHAYVFDGIITDITIIQSLTK
jgi:hypothetical protein